jgi:hypothetical protein
MSTTAAAVVVSATATVVATAVGGMSVVVIVVAAVIAAVMTVDIAMIVTAARAAETIAAPAVVIAPVSPGPYAEEDAVVEVAGAIVAIGCAGVRGVVIVAPPACGRRSANNAILRPADGNAD